MSHRVIPRPGGRRRVLLLLLSGCFLFQVIAGANVKETRRVLILNDLGAVSSPGFAEINQALFAGLQTSPYKIELYQETLDLTLFPDEVSQRRFREGFIRKYSGRKPDLIIAAGSDSLKFIAESREEFVRDSPIIFCTTLWELPDQLKPEMHFTGVVGRLRPEETLNAALHLLPDTKHVVVTGGMGKFDDRWEAIAKQSFHNYESKLDFIYLTNLTMPDLLEQLKHLQSNTIVFHTAITQDATGERFIDSAQAVPLVASAANAPVFVMDDVDLRAGAVGGDLVNWADDARVAAGMAVRVLNGEKPQDIPIVTSNNAFIFDWGALQRWGLNEHNLPPGSIILNRPLSLWQVYRRYILAGILVILAQSLAIFALLWQRSRRRKIEAVLRESEERFYLVANKAPVMIWMSGIDKLCTYFNEPWLEFTGRSMKEELGNGWAEGVHTEDLKTCLETYKTAFDRREPFQMEYRLCRHDGEYRWIFDYGVPRFNADGSFAGYIGSASDVTDRKLAEEALATINQRLIDAQERERGRIARELHDDISQKLALLLIEIEQLKEKPAEIQERVEEIQTRVIAISDDVQSLSHELHPSKLDYLGVVAAIRGLCREIAEKHGVSIEFRDENVPKDLPNAIALCLFRVAQEALHNALKYSGVKHFTVEARGAAEEVQLVVEDMGTGFDLEEVKDRSGLGLVSMQERINIVHGQLSVESQPGEGTRIVASVPAISEDDGAPVQAQCKRAEGHSAGSV